MSADINACNEAKRFIEYLEAFSFANSLTDSISQEIMSLSYSAVFGNRKLVIDYGVKNGKIKINVIWTPALYVGGISPEFRKKYYDIKEKVKLISSSLDSLKETMSFLLDDFGELNVLLDLLTDGS